MAKVKNPKPSKDSSLVYIKRGNLKNGYTHIAKFKKIKT